MNELTPALRAVLDLFTDEDVVLTHKMIAERLGITYNAAYLRAVKLRRAGLLWSQPNWHTIKNGAAPWRDDNGNMRSWLELFLAKGDGPDKFQSIFDPNRRKESENGQTCDTD